MVRLYEEYPRLLGRAEHIVDTDQCVPARMQEELGVASREGIPGIQEPERATERRLLPGGPLPYPYTLNESPVRKRRERPKKRRPGSLQSAGKLARALWPFGQALENGTLDARESEYACLPGACFHGVTVSSDAFCVNS